jgi:hypothetical protein
MNSTLRFVFCSSSILILFAGCGPSPVATLEVEFKMLSGEGVYKEGMVPGRLELVSCHHEFQRHSSGTGGDGRGE